MIVALSVILPPRARRILAIVVGLALGLLTVVKILNIGFFAELDRPWRVSVTDWSLSDRQQACCATRSARRRPW